MSETTETKTAEVVDNVISFNRPQPAPKVEPRCSFCGRHEVSVLKMVRSAVDPSKHICNLCIAQAAERMAETTT